MLFISSLIHGTAMATLGRSKYYAQQGFVYDNKHELQIYQALA